jgi:hypothetical protein
MSNKKKEIKYEIRGYYKETCELWSIVPTNFGGVAENFVCGGTHEHCIKIKNKLESEL